MRIMRFVSVLTGLSLILSCVLSCSAFAQNDPKKDAHTFLIRGITAAEVAKNDSGLAEAIPEFQKAVELDPQLSVAWYNLAQVQARIGRLKEAIANYNQYLALGPPDDQAQKARDEIIKLEYLLEKAARQESRSGMWLESNGSPATIKADPQKIRITFSQSAFFPGSAEVWIRGVLNKPPTTYEYGTAAFDLEVKGSVLEGVFEFSDNSHTGTWCVLPSEKNPVTGILEKGRMALTFKKGKYRVIMDSKTPLFGKPEAICQQIFPVGSIQENLVFWGPLGPGGLKANITRTDQGTYVLTTSPDSAKGLESGDELVQIDGVDVSALGRGEVVYRLSGPVDSEVRLALKRKANGAQGTGNEPPRIISVKRVSLTRSS